MMTTEEKQRLAAMLQHAHAARARVVVSGQTLAALVIELSGFPFPAVRAAIEAALRQRGGFDMARVHEHLAKLDGRPDADAAWLIAAGLEQPWRTVILTTEIQAAWYEACAPLMATHPQGARWAFRANYEARVSAARAARQPPVWLPRIGTDRLAAVQAIDEAKARGRLPDTYATPALPTDPTSEEQARRLGVQPRERTRDGMEALARARAMLGKKKPAGEAG